MKLIGALTLAAGSLLLGAAAFVAFKSAPDIARYLRMRRM